MSWLTRLLPRRPVVPAQHAWAVHAYRVRPPVPADSDITRLRLVVVDVETSGLDPCRDRLLAIGAVALDAMLLRFDDSFSAFMRQRTTSSNQNILVHGIDGTTQISAPAAADGLAAFLLYAGKAPLVAFNADFDRVVIERALRETLGVTLENRWIDLARLAPALLGEERARTLDEWTRELSIDNYRRHDALADATATAQLLQVVLAHAMANGHLRLIDLVRLADAQRWLERR